jgi:hypothetical protein
MTRVLLVGYDPETVDFSNPALPPGMTIEKIRAGIAATLEQMTDRGWEADVCLIRPDETAGQTVERHLASASCDCVVIGAGVRLPPPGPCAVRGGRQRGPQGGAGCHDCFQYAARRQRRCCCPMVAARSKSLCRGTSGPYRARTRAKGDFRYRTAASIKQRYRQPRAGAEINAKGALERTPPHRCSFSGGNLRDALFGRRKFASPSGAVGASASGFGPDTASFAATNRPVIRWPHSLLG